MHTNDSVLLVRNPLGTTLGGISSKNVDTADDDANADDDDSKQRRGVGRWLVGGVGGGTKIERQLRKVLFMAGSRVLRNCGGAQFLYYFIY